MVLQGCALGPAQGIAVGDAVARRKCNMFGEWENPDTDNCITIVSRQFMVLQESIITVSILFLLLVVHSITVCTKSMISSYNNNSSHLHTCNREA